MALSAFNGQTDPTLSTLSQLVLGVRNLPERIVLGEQPLSIPAILSVSRSGATVEFTRKAAVLDRLAECYAVMMKNVSDGVPVYGCNTGYGAQAAKQLNDGTHFFRHWCARSISEAIAAIDVSVGPPFECDLIRGAMLIRINMLMHGISAVRLADLDLIRRLLNCQLTPVVHQFGGLGASGDLAHNARVVSVLRHLQGTRVTDSGGSVLDGPATLRSHGFAPMVPEPKSGLGLCNGDNFSTAAAALMAVDTLDVLTAALFCSAMTIEVLHGSTRVFHPMLAAVRPHPGQQQVADLMCRLLAGSQLAVQEMSGPSSRPDGFSVQEAYCLRGISQYLAVPAERVLDAFVVIERNANSVSDNPLWVPPEHVTAGEAAWQWVSGANFLATHMAEVLDGLRKSLTLIVKLCDRHLARLVNPSQNKGLPANLSDPLAVTNCTFKGVQIQSGMFEVYSQLLSMPVTTLFGIHEEGNQDITTHALTSAILGSQNLQVARYAIAQNLLALAQAVNLRGGPELLSPATRPVYDFVRERVPYVDHEQPLNVSIQTLYDTVVKGELPALLSGLVTQISQGATV